MQHLHDKNTMGRSHRIIADAAKGMLSLPFFLVLIGILSVVLILVTNHINETRFQSSMQADIVADLRDELVFIHLQIMEFISSSGTAGFEKKEPDMKEFRENLSILTDGGLSHHGFSVEVITNDRYKQETANIIKAMERFESIARQIYAAKSNRNELLSLDAMLNEEFREVKAQIETLCIAYKAQYEPNLHQLRRLYLGILGSWTFFLFGAGMYFLRLDGERRRAQKALAEREETYRNLFEHANDAAILWEWRAEGGRGRILEANGMASRMLGYCGKTIAKLSPGDFEVGTFTPGVEKTIGALQPGERTMHETFYRSAAGVEIPVEVSSLRIHWKGKTALLSLARDISHRKQLEKELLRIRNLESISILASGVAHDFNNLFAVVKGYADLLKHSSSEELTPKYLATIQEAVARGVELTGRLISLAEGGGMILRPVDLVTIFKEASVFVTTDSGVQCRYEFDGPLLPVPADLRQVQQVAKNILVNATEAMPEGGTITIAGKYVMLDPAQIPQLRRGKYLVMSVTDTGRGIDAAHMDRVFDPYFTTKDLHAQKGLGLGLAISHAIMKRHGGSIDISSVKGQGTTVTLYFPTEEGAAEEEVP